MAAFSVQPRPDADVRTVIHLNLAPGRLERFARRLLRSIRERWPEARAWLDGEPVVLRRTKRGERGRAQSRPPR